MEVIFKEEKDMPNENSCSIPVGGHLNGRRIGLDVGGSDIKVSAVLDGNVIYSEEIVWLPKLQENVNYQYEYFYNALKKGIEKLGGDVDGIGVSAAGVLVDNKPMVSSIFIKIPKSDFEKVKMIYDALALLLDYDSESYISNSQPPSKWDYVLASRKAVCEGYANAFKKLCDMLKIRYEDAVRYSKMM